MTSLNHRGAAATREAVLGQRVFWISVGLTAVLYAIPYGQYVAYPLVLLSTLVHELGHGITAVLVGGEFQQFQMWPDGSGVAQHAGSHSAIASAVISAGGLVGPAIAAAIGFSCARRARAAQAFLLFIGVGLVIAEVLVVRNLFGLVFVGVVAALCLAAGLRGRALAQVTVVFLSVQLALSVFSRGDYLFTRYAETSAGKMPSDVERMAEVLVGPYWLWGALCGAISVIVLLVSARGLTRRTQ